MDFGLIIFVEVFGKICLDCYVWSVLLAYYFLLLVVGICLVVFGFFKVNIMFYLNGLSEFWVNMLYLNGIIEVEYSEVDGCLEGKVILFFGLEGILNWKG